MSASTEDQQWQAVLRQTVVDSSPKQFIEIWDKQCLAKTYDLTAFDVHGDVYTDCSYSLTIILICRCINRYELALKNRLISILS